MGPIFFHIQDCQYLVQNGNRNEQNRKCEHFLNLIFSHSQELELSFVFSLQTNLKVENWKRYSIKTCFSHTRLAEFRYQLNSENIEYGKF